MLTQYLEGRERVLGSHHEIARRADDAIVIYTLDPTALADALVCHLGSLQARALVRDVGWHLERIR